MAGKLVCIEDYEREALKRLPSIVRDYYKSGAGEEFTLRLNVDAFQKYRIKPRVLVNVANRDISTVVLGHKVSMPLGVSPTAMQRMAHPDGECANVRAAAAAGTIFILSTLSTSSIEEVAEAAPKAVKWFQLYVYKDRNVTVNLVRRAEAAGFKALVLTVDTPMFGERRADRRNKFSLPNHLRLANFVGIKSDKINSADQESGLSEYSLSLFDASLSWEDVDWLRSITHLPIVLKGVLTAEDAILGLEHGASAILVSNHGARQIDGAPASIEALPEIVKAVGSKAEVYLDGGVRQGIDVFKALALGAKMVFVGRPMLWGLTCNGEEGASSVLDILRSEIDRAYALSGCAKTRDIKPSMVVHESVYSRL
ncbi:hydroxyacid oxidase 1 [Neodiprion lecontei]|uniref:(S)-2-hydroxy-acid oxidase n=1 Tax=Neodiprion lecontei TaxID=441921 RepID=A0A6J0BR26_NEOLC|nr:hydroxyacid oxidase 1 [Neodiprion lecontei]